MQFTYVNVGGYGSESDGGIFRNSMLGRMLDQNKIELPEPSTVGGITLPYVFLGDAAFPLRPYLMTPFSGRALDSDKTWHNREHSRGRSCIENAFGILASRWRIFQTTISAKPENADLIIMAAVLLHNYVMKTDQQQYANNNFIDHYTNDGERVEGEWRQIIANCARPGLQRLPAGARMGARNATIEANEIRETIKNLLFRSRI